MALAPHIEPLVYLSLCASSPWKCYPAHQANQPSPLAAKSSATAKSVPELFLNPSFLPQLEPKPVSKFGPKMALKLVPKLNPESASIPVPKQVKPSDPLNRTSPALCQPRAPLLPIPAYLLNKVNPVLHKPRAPILSRALQGFSSSPVLSLSPSWS